MKMKYLLPLLAAAGLLGLTAGCKPEDTSSTTSDTTAKTNAPAKASTNGAAGMQANTNAPAK